MIKGALIGKDIQHSLSPQFYKKNLHNCEYQLIDCATESSVPTLKELSSFQFINITSPYKEYYLKKVELDDSAKLTDSLNLLLIQHEKIQAFNTDYLALLKMVPQINIQAQSYAILGSGVMARVVEKVLTLQGLEFKCYSRSKGNLNSQISADVIINCISRGYKPDERTSFETNLFWDLNYATNLKDDLSGIHYQDGESLLIEQGKIAVDLILNKFS